LHIDSNIARVNWKWEWLSRWKSGIELVIDEKAPNVAKGNASNEIFDIDTSVTERAAFLIRLCDLRFECDDTF
jgi:hypothetical protein